VASAPVTFVKGIPAKLNKKVAREICEKILIPPPLGKGELEGDFELRKLQIPARWEKIPHKPPLQRGQESQLVGREGDFTILEGAHSAPRFEYILPKIKKVTGKKIGVFAMARNHDPKTFQIILPEFEEVIWTTVSGVREFWKPEELSKLMGRGRVEKNPIEAFRQAQKLGEKVIVTGSFYLCGTIRDLFYAPEKILEQRTEFPS
jgi:folylpolyglutamate synthase/dihydropteroate synthase